MQPAVLLRLPLTLQLVAVAAAAAWRHSLMQLDVQRCCYCCCGLALFCMQALLFACNLRRRDAVAGTRRRPLIPVATAATWDNSTTVCCSAYLVAYVAPAVAWGLLVLWPM